DVGGETARQLARTALGEEAWGQPYQVREQIVAQLGDDALGGRRENPDLAEVEQPLRREQPNENERDAIERRRVGAHEGRVQQVPHDERKRERDAGADQQRHRCQRDLQAIRPHARQQRRERARRWDLSAARLSGGPGASVSQIGRPSSQARICPSPALMRRRASYARWNRAITSATAASCSSGSPDQLWVDHSRTCTRPPAGLPSISNRSGSPPPAPTSTPSSSGPGVWELPAPAITATRRDRPPWRRTGAPDTAASTCRRSMPRPSTVWRASPAPPRPGGARLTQRPTPRR